jgi:aminoglycoside phosphotransferase (APT) family kinase protein
MAETTPSPDTAPIRAGERFNLEALSDFLASHLPALAATPPQITPGEGELVVEQFPGGHSNLTYCVTWQGQQMVLRRPPIGPVAPTAHDMPREYRLLAAIHPHFPLAPRPLLLCEDPAVLGAPFYLMERRRGIIIRQTIPPEMGEDLDLRHRVGESLIRALVQLHAIDVASTGLMQLGKPTGFVRRQVEGWSQRWERAKTTDLPEMQIVAAWLRAHLPFDPIRPTLVHNDYKLDNVMLDPVDPTRLIAILDWEMSAIGDPLIDLGLLLCYWPEAGDPPVFADSLGGVTTLPGWPTREELIALYAAESGRSVETIGFYHTFAVFKLAVVLQQIYHRYHLGQTTDPRFAQFDTRVSALADWAHTLMQRSSQR